MSEHERPLLVISCEQHLSQEQRASIKDICNQVADRIGMTAMVADGGLSVQVHRDLQPLVDAITGITEAIQAQVDSSAQLCALVADLLAQNADDDSDMEQQTYMDGSPRR